MDLKELYTKQKYTQNGSFAQSKPVISFEVFPPKNDETGEKLEHLLDHLKILKKYDPAFISLTYGAGGGNQQKSFDIIKGIKELGLNVMPHFTCVGTTKSQVREYLKDIKSLGIKNILALRGDLPDGMTTENFEFHFANELVEFIKSETDLSIGVAGYPEGHIECADLSLDLDNLKRKVDSGADAIYTQLFFENDKFFSFVDTARESGISVPIIPGILPITSYASLSRMLSMVKVSMPESLMTELEKFKDNPSDIKKIGIEFASSQCQQLIEARVQGLHFYTINSSTAVSGILDNL